MGFLGWGKAVVYLLIPTPNHNGKHHYQEDGEVVYLLIPTPNHNITKASAIIKALYIFWFLHQTTTWNPSYRRNFCCISFDSYTKPQLLRNNHIHALVVYLLIPTPNHNRAAYYRNMVAVVYLLIPTPNHNVRQKAIGCKLVVYLLIPTPNHNLYATKVSSYRLYIFWFLHQTTTPPHQAAKSHRCISFDSYTKPQPIARTQIRANVVYLLIPTPNHNRVAVRPFSMYVVYLLIPTPNHNYILSVFLTADVVYLLIPTPNHNFSFHIPLVLALYIFWFLHQTTTSDLFRSTYAQLYIFWFLHQTTTYRFEHTDFQRITNTLSNKKWWVGYNF